MRERAETRSCQFGTPVACEFTQSYGNSFPSALGICIELFAIKTRLSMRDNLPLEQSGNQHAGLCDMSSPFPGDIFFLPVDTFEKG